MNIHSFNILYILYQNNIVYIYNIQNGTGGKKDHAGGCWTESFQHTENELTTSGVMIHQTMYDMPCTYAIAAVKKV